MSSAYRWLAPALAAGLLLASPLERGGSAAAQGSPRSHDGGTIAPAGPALGTYAWPVRGPVLRGFEPPEFPYGPGHRGIDIGAPLGTPIRAPAAGTVAFAGWIGGNRFISVDHADGIRTTYSWVSEISVTRGEAVERGAIIGRTGTGHPGEDPPHLHFGARVGPTYLDPMLLLGAGSLVGLVRLASLEAPVVVRPT